MPTTLGTDTVAGLTGLAGSALNVTATELSLFTEAPALGLWLTALPSLASPLDCILSPALARASWACLAVLPTTPGTATVVGAGLTGLTACAGNVTTTVLSLLTEAPPLGLWLTALPALASPWACI